MFVLLRKTLEEVPVGQEAYFFVYWPLLDGVAHFSGPYSDEVAAEIKMLNFLLKEEFLTKLSPELAKETELVLTADHGQATLSREKCINMENHPNLLQNLIIPFAGDIRAAYLYVKPNKMSQVKQYFCQHFESLFHVMESPEALKSGLFGLGEARRETYDRIGDLIAVSKDGSSIYYSYLQDIEIRYLGFHGGLTQDEMLIPLLCARISQIT
jgi:predicted AlkP superfamily pyrophosphatase or phosphodiesterase